MASTKGDKGTKKKYVPSAKQRAEDARIKDNLSRLSKDDLREFDKLLGRAVKDHR